MKYKFVLIGLLIIFAVLQLKAQVLNEKITAKLQNQPISELVKQIEAQSSYHIYYDEAIFSELKLSFEITNATVKEVMNKAFLNSDFATCPALLHSSLISLMARKRLVLGSECV